MMKVSVIALCALLGLAAGQLPVFHGPYGIADNGTPIDVGWYGAPSMYDWDGDGQKDMIVGQYEYGYIRFYQNIGSDPSPTFNGFTYLSASGSQITLPYG
jgi:hypothetical protein